jgi:hypothetical protein
MGLGRALTLLIAVAAPVWAGNLCFVVSRSHELNGIACTPFFCLAAGNLLYLISRPPWPSRLWSLVSGVLPVVIARIIVGFGNPDGVADALDAVPMGYRSDFDMTLPTVEPSALDLLRKAHVDADDPIAFVDPRTSMGVRFVANHPAAMQSGAGATVWLDADSPPAPEARRLSSAETWLPMTCRNINVPLSEDRKRVYVKRYLERRRVSGWLLISRAVGDNEIAWLYEEIERTHVRGRTFENAEWRLMWWDVR